MTGGDIVKTCISCPRECSVDRKSGERGFCGVGNEYVIAASDLHFWEEPCISGTRGAGTVFFSGCNLRCVFCQNKDISRKVRGKILSEGELIDKMLELESRGAHNIDLVTPTPYAERLAVTLEKAKAKLSVPVIYNCGGYESPKALRALDGLIDVYLPDMKYFSNELAIKYSSAPRYKEAATEALTEMYRQVGKVNFDSDGMITRGLIVRHLVLPSHRNDSMGVLDHLASFLPIKNIMLSLMRQYTPDFADADAPSPLHRRLTSFEYDSVLEYAQKLGFQGFSQSRASATADYTPNFAEKVQSDT